LFADECLSAIGDIAGKMPALPGWRIQNTNFAAEKNRQRYEYYLCRYNFILMAITGVDLLVQQFVSATPLRSKNVKTIL